MAYFYYMAGTRLPVPPSNFTISIPSKNETVTLINDGDINILKKRGLKEFEFEMYLPQVYYPFAVYDSGFVDEKLKRDDIIPPLQYLILLSRLKEDKLPFQLDIYRSLPNGKSTWDTNETVSLEDYTVEEDTDNGFDVVVKVKLKEYVHYATQKVVLSEDGLTYTTQRATDKKINRYVQVKKGDTLATIIKREFGDYTTELYNKIVKLNRDVLDASQNRVADFDTALVMITEGMTLRMTED